ncbi:MAG: shikimate dehydrogenase [Bacteroidetes bacterium]|nr:shikimate dehydrogenase [Bacteroidota bacterium]MCB9227749.1 shikimate dehydrogenase [Chitinophagales bacterium]
MNKLKKYGLIGYPLSHSFSPAYFKQKFEKENILAQYDIFPLKDIKDFRSLVDKNNLQGLNVTIPYKEAVIEYLDEIDEEAKMANAVNCIRFRKGKAKGYNTDIFGFEQSIFPLLNGRNKALILGTGGAAKAVQYVFKKLGVSFQLVSRYKSEDSISYKEMNKIITGFNIVVNTTPLGMYPNITECPVINFDKINSSFLFYDLIYNPAETVLIQKAQEKGAMVKNGLEMLELQAEESWRIWDN